MRAGFLLVSALLFFAGCESGDGTSSRTAQGSRMKELLDRGVRFEGGNGNSINQAVIIKAPNELTGVRAEYEWIREHYPGWELEQQETISIQGRTYDMMDFRTPGGIDRTLYFDITDFFGKQ